MNNLDELKNAHKKEKSGNVVSRIHAVRMFYVKRMKVKDIADILEYSPDWVHMWIKRYEDGGLDGLRDLARSGRPPAIPYGKMDLVMTEAAQLPITPMTLRQNIIEKHNVKFHITYVRKIMRKHGLSRKTAQTYHINRADRKTVYRWRYRTKKRISRLRKDGFTILMEDEAFFTYDVATSRKYWSPAGRPIAYPYIGKHRRIAVYGSVTADGRQLFRTYDRFNSDTIEEYLLEMHRHFGKVVVITDRASPHRAKNIRELLRRNKEIKIIYLPRGSPYLNLVEECWHQAKLKLLVSEYYRRLSDLQYAISEYFRTMRFHLDD